MGVPVTVWETAMEVLPLKMPSPAYVAVINLAPGVVDIKLHIPEATVPTQVAVPSLTVTLPVGVPLVAGVTLNVT